MIRCGESRTLLGPGGELSGAGLFAVDLVVRCVVGGDGGANVGLVGVMTGFSTFNAGPVSIRAPPSSASSSSETFPS